MKLLDAPDLAGPPPRTAVERDEQHAKKMRVRRGVVKGEERHENSDFT
jgi:hypothetical protein